MFDENCQIVSLVHKIVNLLWRLLFLRGITKTGQIFITLVFDDECRKKTTQVELMKLAYFRFYFVDKRFSVIFENF